MNWETWRMQYEAIATQLNLSMEKDQRATLILDSLLSHINPQPLLKELQTLFHERTVVVCGAGPSLDDAIQRLKSKEIEKNLTIVAADGALEALYEQEISCQVVVTDLDGDRGHLKETVSNGTLAVVHAHGDNIRQMKRVVPQLEYVLGSTQVQPTKRVFLWGGFTDGDRACYLVAHYQPTRVVLAGMDFGTVVGHWSKPEYLQNVLADDRKKMKLAIGEELLHRLIKRVPFKFEKLE